MTQPQVVSPQRRDSLASQGYKKAPTSEVTTSPPPIDQDQGVPTAVGPYRLYKRRWFGVFAMASINCFSLNRPNAEIRWIVCAGSRECRQLAVVWPYSQQWCGTVWFPALSDITDVSSVVRDFGFTLDEVNWLGNIIACVYLPTACLTPIITKRYGIRRCVCPVSRLCRISSLTPPSQCDIAAVLLLLSAWVRYAGTARSLSKGGAYTFIFMGQV